MTAFAPLTESDFEALARLTAGRRRLKRGEIVCREGEPSTGLFLLLQGWVASSVTFADGARQLLNVHLAGDLLGTPDLALRRSAQSMVAITPVELGIISQPEMGRLFENSPRLAAILFLIAQEERVTLMDRLAAVGATEALHSLASLLVHIHARVVRSDPETGYSFMMPLSQDDLSALIGISPVHLNRTLQQLRHDGLIEWTRHRVTLLDHAGLMKLSGLPARQLDYNPTWLPRSR